MKPADQIITDKEAICKATNMPKSAEGFLPTQLKPIGESKFKGDGFTGQFAHWSVNDKFTKDETYPVYDYDGMQFVVGSNGKGYKITPTAWTKIKYYKK